METKQNIPDFRKDLSAVIKLGLTLLLMLVVSGLLGYLPGADLLLGDRVPIVVLLRFAIAVGMAAVLLFAYRQISRLLRQGVVALLFLRGPSTDILDAAAAKVAKHTTLLLYVWLLYGIVMRGSEPLIVILTPASWPFTAIRVCGIVLAVIALIGLLVGASPLFQEAGDTLAGRVTMPAKPSAAQIKCPGCGVLDEGGSNYCRFCGRLLAEAAEAPPAAPLATTCTRCGNAVPQPARFCPTCGKPL